jgi:hypothetical protein
MSLNDWRIIFLFTGCLIILIIISPLALDFFPSNKEQYTSLAVMGKSVTEGQYFTNNFSNITIGQEMNWNLEISNHMATTQYMLVKVKFLDSKMSPPNNTIGTPSEGTSVYEIEKILTKNETEVIPFKWSILNSSNLINNELRITKISFNGQPSDQSLNFNIQPSDLTLINGVKFVKLRIVFELWLYDTNVNAFKFNVDTAASPRIVWNQIWFNLSAGQ